MNDPITITFHCEIRKYATGVKRARQVMRAAPFFPNPRTILTDTSCGPRTMAATATLSHLTHSFWVLAVILLSHTPGIEPETTNTVPWYENLPAVAMDYKVHIDPGKEDCYFQYVNPGATFYVSFQVRIELVVVFKWNVACLFRKFHSRGWIMRLVFVSSWR